MLGIFKKAKEKGYIIAVRPYLDKLRFTTNFKMNPKLYTAVLEDVGELYHHKKA
jgi:predicted nucleic acid-binding protein